MFYWGLLGLISIPVLLGIYLFRIRYPRKMVSSLFLWDFPEFRLQKGSKKNKFINERSFWLELIALVLLTLLLLNLGSFFGMSQKHYVYVLDSSFSLQARSQGVAIFEQIKSEIKKEINSNNGRFSILLAEENPKVIAGPLSEKSMALNSLDRWNPISISFDWFLTVELIREFAGNEAKVIVYSDREIDLSRLGKEVEIRLRGEALENNALLNCNFEETDEGKFLNIFAKSFGAQKEVLVEALIDGVSNKMLLKNSDNAFYHGSMALPKNFNKVVVRLQNDSLEADNQFVLLNEKKRPLRVVLKISDEKLSNAVQEVLGYFSQITLVKSDPHLVIADQLLPELSVPILYIKAPEEILGRQESKNFFGQYIKEKEHPLLKDLDFNFQVFKDCKFINKKHRPLLHREGVTIFGELLVSKGEVYFWNTDLFASKISEKYAWPLFWENVLMYFSQRIEGLRHVNVFTGGENSFFQKTTTELVVKGSDGSQIKVFGRDKIVLPSSKKPGIFTLLHNEKPLAEYSVNLIDSDLSNLNSCKTDTFFQGKKDSLVHEVRSFNNNSYAFNASIILLVIGLYMLNLYLDRIGERGI